MIAALAGACSSGPAAAPAADPPRTAPSVQWISLDPAAEPGALGASLAATAHGVLATWIEPRGTGHRVRIARLSGDAWTPPSTVLESDDLVANWADFPRAAQGGDGAIYVSYAVRRGSSPAAYDAVVARAIDPAGPFVALGTLHRDGTETEHGFVSMVAETSGVRAFWLDGRATAAGGAMALFTAQVGETIGADVPIDDRTCDCCQTDAARSGAGSLVVFRNRDRDEEIRDIALARSAEERFAPAAVVHHDRWHMAGCPVNGPAIDADPSRVVVAWFTGADGGAARVAFGRPDGTFEQPIDVDATQPPGRVDVALLDDGAAVSWLARTENGAGEVRVRFVGASGALGEPTVVGRTSALRAGGFPVMARDGDRLLVAHRDGAEPPRVRVSWLAASALPRRASSASAPPGAAPRISPGARLPRTARVSTGADVVELDALARGRPIVIAFFARWCEPCRDELAQLEALRVAHPEALFVAVSVDEGPAERAQATARAWGFGGEVVRDAGASTALGVPPLPGVLVVDRGGVVRLAEVGRRVDSATIQSALR